MTWCTPQDISDHRDDVVRSVAGPRFYIYIYIYIRHLYIYIKMSSYQYRKSHCGVKTILRPSYLHNGIGFPILVRRHLYIESGPWTLFVYKRSHDGLSEDIWSSTPQAWRPNASVDSSRVIELSITPAWSDNTLTFQQTWPLVTRRHYETQFHLTKYSYFYSNYIGLCSHGSMVWYREDNRQCPKKWYE